jgi:hypothetical protein
MPKAFEKFQDVIQSQLANRSIAYSDFGFTIDTDAIVLYSDGTFESLTFMVTLDKDRGYLENLILNKEDDGTYSVYYSVYNLSEQDKVKVANNLNVDINGKYFLCPLPGFKTSSLMAKGGDGIIRHDGKCFVEKLVRVNSYSNIPGQLEFSRFEWKEVEVPCPGPEQDIDYGYTYYNGGNGGGGTPTNIYFNTPTGHEGVPPPAISINGPIAGGGHPRPVITRPFIDVRIKAECDKILNIMANESLNFKAKVVELATHVNESFEAGFTVDDINNVVTLPSGQSLSPNLNPINKYIAFSHTHNAATDGTYSVFSFADLRTLSAIVYNNKIDSGKFLATLSTSKGTHYLLTINDISKFEKFFYYFNNSGTNPSTIQQYLNSYNKASPIEKKYYRDPTTPRISQTNTDNEAVLKEFLEFLNEADMGVTLYETDATFNNFMRVSKPSGSNKISRDLCGKLK